MDGRTKCKVLKGIRQRIADINGIPYKPHPCNNSGDCLGTCPMCDEELAWLQLQINIKSSDGHRVYITKDDIDNYEKSLNGGDKF